MQERINNFAGYKCKMLNFTSEGIPIVFLHGHSYDRTIWQKLRILDLLISKKVPFLALDMPYGAISECKPKTQDPQTNVTVANEAIQYLFGLTAPVIVGASLGGHIALRYAQQHPVKGLLLVAPAFVFEDAKLTSAYSRFDFPVRIIWGSEDNIILGEDMRTLSDILPNSKLVTYNGATHSAYKDQPDRFKRDLLELYALAE